MTDQASLSLHAQVTPPGSITAYPQTPPPTDKKSTSTVLRILEEIRNRKAGVSRVTEPWLVYTLDAEGYQDLLQRIQQDTNLAGWVDDKLRSDYFPSTRRFVLRMPTTVHETFLDSVVDEIKRQSSWPASSRFTSEDPGYGKHEPDGQFQHFDAQFPGVVIEVSYSQKKKDLPHLADDYILGSDSNIKVVVGLDIEYREREKKATWSAWEPRVEKDENGEDVLIAKQIVDNMVFRTPAGTSPVLSPASNLHIPLHAFASSSCYPSKTPPTGSIIFSTQTLCTFLQEAETLELIMTQKAGRTSPKTWGKKRRRAFTLEEELLEKDEKRFKAEEDKALELKTRDDESFVGAMGLEIGPAWSLSCVVSNLVLLHNL